MSLTTQAPPDTERDVKIFFADGMYAIGHYVAGRYGFGGHWVYWAKYQRDVVRWEELP